MLKDKIKSLMINSENKDSKKKIENIVVFIIILIITVIAINSIWNKDSKSSSKENIEHTTEKQLAVTENVIEGERRQQDLTMEEKLESILSKIENVGKVKVLITYSESSEVVAMYNENSKNSVVEEKDSGGGMRTTTQNDSTKDIIYKEEDGKKVPITQKVINPKIEGAIITAVGANNGTTKNNIVQAVEAVTGLPTHKIQVFEMKNE